LTATIRATDLTGNSSVASRVFKLPDTRPPQLVSVNPTNGAVKQSLWLAGLTFDFDEALDPTGVTTNNIIVTNNVASATAFNLSLQNGNQRLLLSLARPPVPGAIYTNILLQSFSDVASNKWQNVGGSNVPPD